MIKLLWIQAFDPGIILLLYDNTLLQHNICVQSFFAGGNDAISFLCFLIECKTLDVSDGFIASLDLFGDDLFVSIPDRGLYIIARHHFHQIYRMLYVGIQRKQP